MTIEFAQETGTPYLIVDVRRGAQVCALRVQDWIKVHPIEVLNIAGPRESEAPEIGEQVAAVLRLAVLPDLRGD